MKDEDHKNINACKSAIFGTFPGIESFYSFIHDNNKDTVLSIINFARANQLIEKSNQKALLEYIEHNTFSINDKIDSDNFNFDRFKREAKIKSIRWLTREVNKMSEDLNIKFPVISNVMFTRLLSESANTAAKRNTLRVLSFWVGYYRSDLYQQWNFHTFLNLCQKNQRSKSNEGVRIAFSLQSRGDVINEKSIKWFKNELKKCLNDLNIQYANFTGSQSFQLTEFVINLPKESNEMDGYSHPGSYNRCIRDAVAATHQMLVRWSISEHNSPKKSLIIGIAAGEFSNVDHFLKPIISSDMHCNPAIRLTDFAYQCVLINRVRVIVCNEPSYIKIVNGEVISAWCIKGLWNTLYLDFIPDLMSKSILKNTNDAHTELKNILWFEKTSHNKHNIIKTFLKYPHNSILGLEIAKTLYFRRIYWAANEILEFMLKVNALDLTARTLRMLNSWNMGASFDNYAISAIQFNRAETEARFIEKNCDYKDEDFYCEYGLTLYVHAIFILQMLRKNDGQYIDQDAGINLSSKNVFELLDRAEKIFEHSFSVPTTGNRSLFWLLYCRSLKRILMQSNSLFQNENPIYDTQNIVTKVVGEIVTSIGWLSAAAKDAHLLQQKAIQVLKEYENSVYLRSYKPNVMFSIACATWDFTAELTYGDASRAIFLLKNSIQISKTLKKDQMGIYSVLGLKLISANDFIREVQNNINAIEKKIGSIDEISARNQNEVIPTEMIGGLKLFLVNI
jgi:hypothetical protein